MGCARRCQAFGFQGEGTPLDRAASSTFAHLISLAALPDHWSTFIVTCSVLESTEQLISGGGCPVPAVDELKWPAPLQAQKTFEVVM